MSTIGFIDSLGHKTYGVASGGTGALIAISTYYALHGGIAAIILAGTSGIIASGAMIGRRCVMKPLEKSGAAYCTLTALAAISLAVGFTMRPDNAAVSDATHPEYIAPPLDHNTVAGPVYIHPAQNGPRKGPISVYEYPRYTR